MKRVIASSGGGAKGIAQVQVLKKLEEDARKPLCRTADLLVGSSVGAIDMAVAATGRISMEEYCRNYRRYIRRIFKKTPWYCPAPKYNRDNFRAVWDEIVGADFLFSDVHTKLIISSVDMVNDKNHYFKSWHTKYADTPLVDIIMRSFAAPYYFGFLVDNTEKTVWADGGTGTANYPIHEMKNQIETFHWYSFPCEEESRQIRIDIVGALYPKNTATFAQVKRYRTFRQMLDFFDICQGGLARAQSRNNQIGMICHTARHNTNIKLRYWDHEIPLKMNGIDGLKYLDYYENIGRKMSIKPLISIN
ncbi:MAG: patatin-like phospholipase family protein [Fibrobacterota bacterium]